MHERSLVRSLLSQIEELRLQHDAVTIDVVTVEIGPLSGVEPELVRQAFEEITANELAASPELHINLVPLHIRCECCGWESAVDEISLKCASCASGRVRILRGDEFRLIDVAMQVPVTESC